MSQEDDGTGRRRWGRLRFAIVGPLLASPPPRGELSEQMRSLAQRTWQHPLTSEPVRFGFSTIERWYHTARDSRDPLRALTRQVRRDAGQQPSLSLELRQALRAQYQEHRSWSVQLHYDNLAARVRKDPSLGPLPSYQSVRRFMKAQGLYRQRKRPHAGRPGDQRAVRHRAEFEVRSYEVTHVHGLWHADFHHGSRKVLRANGSWKTPILLGVVDDHSRLCCHLQWYLEETAEVFVHGLSQAIQKRGLPRMLLTDNGAAMTAAETTQGLGRLGIVQELTLPYTPEQNAKQETFWAIAEGRLMSMIEGVEDLTLALLNEATQAWVELEYHRSLHSGIGTTPLERYLKSPAVGRPAPSSQELGRAFRAEVMRTQRRSDQTISLCARRFEVPGRFRHLGRVHVRYASWDLSIVDLVDSRTGQTLCALYPLDKNRNASGRRRRLQAVESSPPAAEPVPSSGMAPLLAELLAEYAATGLPPAYLPKAPK